MMSVSDYISMALLALVGIAGFLNVIHGTIGEWLQAKFLGKTSKGTPTTPFSPTKAAA